jgi:hypothetical protein
MDLPGLSFLPGIGVQAAIRDRLGQPVHHLPDHGSKGFILLASFGRCKFKLSNYSVGLILQATIGGAAVDFRPQQLSDRVFSFVVSSRDVGFHVYNLRSYSCDQYVVFFNLWSNGGANCRVKFDKYCQEDNQWTEVTNKKAKQKFSYVDAVRNSVKLSGANRTPIGNSLHRPSFFQRISWPQKNVNLSFKNQLKNFKNRYFRNPPQYPRSDHTHFGHRAGLNSSVPHGAKNQDRLRDEG